MQRHSSLLDSVIKYTIAAILAGVPLYPKFPFLKIPGTFVAVRLEDFLIAFSAFLLFIAVLPNIRSFLKDPVTKSILLFLTVGLVSLVSAIAVTQTVVPHIGLLHWIRRVEYFIPLFLGMESIRRYPKNLEFYLKILFIVVVIVFIYGFGQKSFEWPIIITQNQEYSKGVALRYLPGSHINSTFAGHYDLATFLVLVLPIVISGFFLLKGTWTKLFLTAVFFSGLWLLVNTASRISLASYLVASVSTLFLIRKYKAIPLVLIVSVIFVGFSSNLVSRYGRLLDVIKKDLPQFQLNYVDTGVAFAADGDLNLKRKTVIPTPTPIPVIEDRSTNIRLNVEWPRAIRAFVKNPLLGTGYSSITLATDNDYLRLLGELGILGFFAFFLIFAKIGIAFLRSFPLQNNLKGVDLVFVSGVMGSLPGVFINAVFIDVFEASKFAIVFWLFMGISLSLTKYTNNE